MSPHWLFLYRLSAAGKVGRSCCAGGCCCFTASFQASCCWIIRCNLVSGLLSRDLGLWELVPGRTKVDWLFLDWLNEACCEEYCACGRTDKGVSRSSAAFWCWPSSISLSADLMQWELTGFGNTGQLNHCWICHPQNHWSSFPLGFPPLLITFVFFLLFLSVPLFFLFIFQLFSLLLFVFHTFYLFWSFVQCKCLPLSFFCFGCSCFLFCLLWFNR